MKSLLLTGNSSSRSNLLQWKTTISFRFWNIASSSISFLIPCFNSITCWPCCWLNTTSRLASISHLIFQGLNFSCFRFKFIVLSPQLLTYPSNLIFFIWNKSLQLSYSWFQPWNLFRLALCSFCLWLKIGQLAL